MRKEEIRHHKKPMKVMMSNGSGFTNKISQKDITFDNCIANLKGGGWYRKRKIEGNEIFITEKLIGQRYTNVKSPECGEEEVEALWRR